DSVRLTQVLTNLLNNAAKYTPSGGRIAIRLDTSPEDAVIEVTDSGVGLAPQKLANLFDRKWRVHEPGEEAGLGLGLPLVKRLVELHGGSVKARSEGAGRGSTFVVRL